MQSEIHVDIHLHSDTDGDDLVRVSDILTTEHTSAYRCMNLAGANIYATDEQLKKIARSILTNLHRKRLNTSKAHTKHTPWRN